MSNNQFFQFGGCLSHHAPSYIKRQADEELYGAIKAGEYCYVMNCRQMGKSSLRLQTIKRLEEEGINCVSIDLIQIGSYHVTESHWYAGIVRNLAKSLGLAELAEEFNWRTWWREREYLSPLERLQEFVDKIVLQWVKQDLVIFLDEIDNLLCLDFSVDDFFAFLRFCYSQRSENSAYQRLTWVLLGVGNSFNLRRDFKIGKGISLAGFNLEEMECLAGGLVGKVSNPQIVLKEVWAWTGGQPFLTQKLCQLICNSSTLIESGKEAEAVEKIVRSRITNNWLVQDEPQHLRTIRDRVAPFHARLLSNCSNKLRLGGLLKIYQQVLVQGEVAEDKSWEQLELEFSNLVVRKEGKLRVSNLIYQEVFNLNWLENQLKLIYSSG